MMTYSETGTTELNINEIVFVRLTDHGKRILRESGCQYIKTENDGWSKWQLWDLMQSFGSHIHFGNRDLPFETTIRIPRTTEGVSQ